jgi:hypothetical protein
MCNMIAVVLVFPLSYKHLSCIFICYKEGTCALSICVTFYPGAGSHAAVWSQLNDLWIA